MHVTGPCVEPQDVPMQFRHLQSGLAYLTLTDKAPYLYARGRGQVADGFEMFRIGYGVDHETFASAPRCYTVINSNSPRQLDIPMCMGLIDFADGGPGVDHHAVHPRGRDGARDARRARSPSSTPRRSPASR